MRDPERLRVALPSSFSPESHDEPDGSFVPKDGARRFDSGWIGAPALAGLEAALDVHPEWRYEGAADARPPAAASCSRRSSTSSLRPASRRSSRSAPPGDPAELVAALHERGVIVRELPGRNLVRASCGWWTSEDDLRRLVDGLGG